MVESNCQIEFGLMGLVLGTVGIIAGQSLLEPLRRKALNDRREAIERFRPG